MYSYYILYLMSYAIYFPLMMFAAAIINAPIITEHISIVTQIAAIVLLFIHSFWRFNGKTFLNQSTIIKMVRIEPINFVPRFTINDIT